MTANPSEHPDPVLLTDVFDFLGGVDGAVELRGRVLAALQSTQPQGPAGEHESKALRKIVGINVHTIGAAVRMKDIARTAIARAKIEAAALQPAIPDTGLREVLDRLRAACTEAGSQALWALAHDISAPYVSDVLNGRRDPADRILAALGFERVVTYRALASATLPSVETGATAFSGWASQTLARCYHAVEKLQAEVAQPSESGISESLRAALDAIEAADCELEGATA